MGVDALLRAAVMAPEERALPRVWQGRGPTRACGLGLQGPVPGLAGSLLGLRGLASWATPVRSRPRWHWWRLGPKARVG